MVIKKKLLLLANNTREWKRWGEHVAVLKRLFLDNPTQDGDIIELDVMLKHVMYEPEFVDYPVLIDGKVEHEWIAKWDWLYEVMQREAIGYDYAGFVMQSDTLPQQDRKMLWGVVSGQGPAPAPKCVFQITMEESDIYLGKRALPYTIAHEICHFLYQSNGLPDRTHEFWYANDPNGMISHVNLTPPRFTDYASLPQVVLQKFISALESLARAIAEKNKKAAGSGIGLPPITETKTMLEKWADAIKEYEGWFEGSRSQRNNNPGNLRWSPFMVGKEGGFAKFATFSDGYKALLHQLRIATNGKSRVYRPEMTLLEFFSTYAPASDSNHPRAYAEFVARKLGVNTDTKINTLNEPTV